MNAIALECVEKFFRRSRFRLWRNSAVETHALKGISLAVAPGEVFGLLGPNGSGKSTTLKLVSTVLLPDRGVVRVGGYDSRTEGASVRKRVGFALASERSFFPRLTVRENLEFFGALENVPRCEIRGRIAFVLARVGLSDAANKQAMKLSAGMYQRLGIARALVKNPSVLLLDEPTRSLDATGADEIWGLIRELSGGGATVLLATHNFAEAAAVCDRIGLLCRGELLALRQTTYLTAETVREFYIETAGQGRNLAAMEVPA